MLPAPGTTVNPSTASSEATVPAFDTLTAYCASDVPPPALAVPVLLMLPVLPVLMLAGGNAEVNPHQ